MFIITFTATADSTRMNATNGCTLLVQADNEAEAERIGHNFLPVRGQGLLGQFGWLWKTKSIERLQKGDAFVGCKLPPGSTAC